MKSNTEYSSRQFAAIKRLYDSYNKRLSNYAIFAEYERVDNANFVATVSGMYEDFKTECIKTCPNRFALCDIILDICYSRSATKKFAWGMCGTEIIRNLLVLNNYKISYPIPADDGDIVYCGNTYSIETAAVEEVIK